MTMPTASLMMVTYNRLSSTQKMLKGLKETTDYPYRLLIVDNGSTDGTVDWIKNYNPDDEYCIHHEYSFNPVNLGIAIGRNQALKMANKYNDEWLSTIDNDVEFPKGWLKECIEIIQANPKFAIGVNMECVPYPVTNRNGKTFQLKDAGNLGTACTVFNRELHKLIGYFITDFGLYGEEDADFFFRARMVGYEMGYLEKMGNPFPGNIDSVEYREFKNKSHADNLSAFRRNCALYSCGKKSVHINY